ncbi:MAG TPA: GTP pyrophosphokinase family protein [Thermoclostridium caenicola]|uniref:Putative GTP pyrophosphokinase n=1 Tax=Thermoclostridium caenicola TaxID=659425 RepID=A0A1M6IED2_9FIRM|nr:GTP pyrophosphokinase family protein [Thermoclostridium caenicola]SHJ32785.1 putative GTP pyrophosphokinase [Thermoclostridium caenicola]HOK42705.1 GTP pyrophosphokinase family protein [Thermoclostridium caenicola]HOL84412.1 GTP pyrophosphokinase family protein [Thermoclostridium caenicola]HPO75942.1 GTP pyrophosphokinase family protein [Thermoclostridium caenicola]
MDKDTNDSFGSLYSDGADSQVYDLTTELMTMDDALLSTMWDQSKEILNFMIEFKELMMMYKCAIKAVKTKFEVLDTEFKIRYQRNPINFIKTRLKRTSSIMEKMRRKNIPFSLENIERYINDVAGVRVICSYVDDIYSIAKALIKQDDVKLIEKKDYIINPKPNGYRSLHLIISVPVFFAEQRKDMKVEVQIRTIAMDSWASLEHQLRYKQEIANEEEIARQLRECADLIADIDSRMLDIRTKIEASSSILTEEEILLNKLSKIDTPLE